MRGYFRLKKGCKTTVEIERTSAGDAFTVKVDGVSLYSPHNPIKRARDSAPPARENTLYLAPSPLFGYGLLEWAETLPVSSKIVAVECDERLAPLTRRALASAPFPVLFSKEKRDIEAVLATFDRAIFLRVELIPVTGGYRLNKSIYDELFAYCVRSIEIYAGNIASLKRNGRRWFTNIIRNIPLIAGGTSSRLVSIGTKTVVVAGAGESLERNVDLIARYRSSLFLLAVDTAVPVLRAFGLIPDLVFALEGGFYNVYDFLGERDSKLPMTCDIAAYPQTCRVMAGPVSFYSSQFAQCALLNRVATDFGVSKVDPLGSVGVSATAFALNLTRGKVALCGLDFAFRLGKSHARGSYMHALQMIHRSRTASYPFLNDAFARAPRKIRQTETGIVYTDAILESYARSVAMADDPRLIAFPSSGYPLHLKDVTPEDFVGDDRPRFVPFLPKIDAKTFAIREVALLENYLTDSAALPGALDYLSVDGERSATVLRERSLAYLEEWTALLPRLDRLD